MKMISLKGLPPPRLRSVLGFWCSVLMLSLVDQQNGGLLTRAEDAYPNESLANSFELEKWSDESSDRQDGDPGRSVYRDRTLTVTSDSAFHTTSTLDTEAVTENPAGKKPATDASSAKPSRAERSNRHTMRDAALVAALCLGLLVFYSLPASAKEKPVKVEQEQRSADETLDKEVAISKKAPASSRLAGASFKEAIGRLEAVQALKPAAEVLAATTASSEGLACLEKLKEALQIAQHLRDEVGRGRQTADTVCGPIERLIDKGLSAIRQLEGVARGHVDAVARDMRTDGIPRLTEHELELMESVAGPGHTNALAYHLNSLKAYSVTLQRHAMEVCQRISECKPFQDVQDADSLARIASHMKSLEESKAALVNVEDMCENLREDAKLVVKFRSVKGLQYTYQDFAALTEAYAVSCQLATRSVDATADNGNTQIMGTIADSEDILRRCVVRLGKFLAEIEGVRDAQTLEAIGAANKKAEAIANELKTLLEAAAARLHSVPSIRSAFLGKDENLRGFMWVLASRWGDMAMQSFRSVQNTMKKIENHPSGWFRTLPETGVAPAKYLNPAVVRLVKESVERILTDVQREVLYALSLADEVADPDSPTPAEVLARQSQASAAKAAEMSGQADLLHAHFQLLTSLELDMQQSDALMSRAAAHTFAPAGEAAKKAETLRQQFDEVKLKVKTLWSHQSIAEAAARMKETASAMVDIVYRDTIERGGLRVD